MQVSDQDASITKGEKEKRKRKGKEKRRRRETKKEKKKKEKPDLQQEKKILKNTEIFQNILKNIGIF